LSDPFTEVLRDGARRLIEQPIHAELAMLKSKRCLSSTGLSA